MTLTPEIDKPIYTSNPTTPIHLRNEILIELALVQCYDIITTISFSKYSSPIFAQRKSSGKLRTLIDLRRINHLLRHTNKNFPIPTMSDASAHLAGKKIFAKMDRSQAYFSMQTADEKSVQLLAFNFGGRTFAFKRLAQGLEASDGNKLLENLEAILKSDQELSYQGRKASSAFLRFSFLDIKETGLSPNTDKVQKFPNNIKMSKFIKKICKFIGFIQYFQKIKTN